MYRTLVAGIMLACAGCARGHSPEPTLGHGADWGYEGETGPARWASLSPQFSICGSGQRQSPIDLLAGAPTAIAPPILQYVLTKAEVVDLDHTVQANFRGINSMKWNGSEYELIQFHVHHPSEHLVEGRSAALEVHLVHRRTDSELAVLGVLFDVGKSANGALRTLLQAVPEKEDDKNTAFIDPHQLVAGSAGYFTYEGSLTNPPCTEGVRWLVLSDVRQTTQEQITKFTQLFHQNARPVQSRSDRLVQRNASNAPLR